MFTLHQLLLTLQIAFLSLVDLNMQLNPDLEQAALQKRFLVQRSTSTASLARLPLTSFDSFAMVHSPTMANDGSSMPPPAIVELTELPHELLVQIINPLDDESICVLAKTCRTLHFVAPPLFLSRYGVCILPPNCVSITCPSTEALTVLQASLFMENVKNIQFSHH